MKEKPDEAWDTFSFNRVKGFSGFYRSRGFRVVVAASPQKKKANPASLRSAAPSKGRGLRGYSLLPMEGGAPKGRRLDGESGIFVSQPSPRGEGAP